MHVGDGAARPSCFLHACVLMHVWAALAEGETSSRTHTHTGALCVCLCVCGLCVSVPLAAKDGPEEERGGDLRKKGARADGECKSV